jgi:hypothetical protein
MRVLERFARIFSPPAQPEPVKGVLPVVGAGSDLVIDDPSVDQILALVAVQLSDVQDRLAQLHVMRSPYDRLLSIELKLRAETKKPES